MRAANTTDRNHADEGAMSRAASALRHLRTINETIAGKVLGHGLAELGGMALDVAIGPFGNIGRTFAKGIDHKKARIKSTREEKDQELQSLSDELLDALRHFLHGKKLPVVVFVDDAQWIDAESMGMLTQLWASAKVHNWPLLVLATHWETEWNQNLRKQGEERAATLARFDGDERASALLLKFTPSADLAAWVRAELPGLTAKQVDLLVDKAGANFLQMTQNARGLQRMAKSYFVGGTARGALTPAGERYVGTFETDPVKRAKQMFEELPPGVQSALGWSSHFGMRFLRDVAVAFAARMGVRMSSEPEIEPDAALREAVDPLAILAHASEASENLTEFRQGAFHAVAKKHLSVLMGDDIGELDAALREVLQEWINNSFDEDAEVIYEGEPETGALPVKAASLLAEEEQRDLLAWALKLFPCPPQPDWSDPDHRVAVRAGWLALALELAMDKPVRAAEIGKSVFADSDGWNTPVEVLGALAQDSLASNLGWVNLHKEAAAWLRWQLSWLEEEVPADRVPYWRYDAEWRLADQLSTLGQYKEAAVLSARSLAYAREQLAQADTDEDRNELRARLAWRLTDEGNLRETEGRLAEADKLHGEALELRRALVEELGTPESRRDVSVSLNNVGDIAEANGDLETALAHYEESLATRRALAEELGTPASRRDVSVSLDNIGDIAKANGDLETALAHYEESLSIARALSEELGTPDSRRDVSLSLDRVGDIAKEKGDLETALAHYEESLEIRRALAEELGTPESRRDVSVSLNRVGDIAKAHGDLELAQSHYEESLTIDRALYAEFALEVDLNQLVWNTGIIAALLLKQGNARESERRLDEWRDLVGKLEASEDSGIVDTAAAHWEHKAACSEALGRVDEARAHAARAVELRNHIAAMEANDGE
jgi:tetratricopeptide (TPR) repeat protein